MRAIPVETALADRHHFARILTHKSQQTVQIVVGCAVLLEFTTSSRMTTDRDVEIRISFGNIENLFAITQRRPCYDYLLEMIGECSVEDWL